MTYINLWLMDGTVASMYQIMNYLGSLDLSYELALSCQKNIYK